MRVLVVSNMYPSAANPHYGVFIDKYVRFLATQSDVDVRVAAITDSAKGALRTPLKYANLMVDIVRTWAVFRPDVVHCHFALPSGIPVTLLAHLKRTPYVLTVHGGDVYEMPRRLPFGEPALRFVVCGAAHVVAVGDQLADDLRNMLVCDAPPISVINMGVDLERFRPIGNEPRNMQRLAYVGLLIERKGVDLLLEAMTRLRGDATTVDVFGTGPFEATLRAQAKRLGLDSRVRLHGVVDQRELPGRLGGCGALVVPSRREPLGIVALEGMAMGMVVVASRVGGLAELIDDGRNGLLFAPGDPAALAEALTRAQSLSNDELATMRDAARETANANAADRQAAKNLQILRQVSST